MFGEKPIYGQSTIRTDNKGRFIIPKFTNVSPDDELLIMRDNNGVRVVSMEYIDEYIEYLEKLCREEMDSEKHQLIKNRLSNIFESILRHASCDNAHRLLLSNVLEPNKSYLVVGCRTSILIKEAQEGNKKIESKNPQKQLKQNT